MNLANTAFATDLGPENPLVIVFAVASIVLSWVLLVRGPVSIGWVNKMVAPGLTVMTVFILVLIFVDTSWGELLAADPIEPVGVKALDFILAIEINLAAGFSWWNPMGNLARLARTQRVAFLPNMIGLYAVAVLAEIVGLLTALSLGSIDPTVWMVSLGGAALGVLTLVFVIFANITSMVSVTYTDSLALLRALGGLAKRVRWATLTGALFLPAAGVFFP